MTMIAPYLKIYLSSLLHRYALSNNKKIIKTKNIYNKMYIIEKNNNIAPYKDRKILTWEQTHIIHFMKYVIVYIPKKCWHKLTILFLQSVKSAFSKCIYAIPL